MECAGEPTTAVLLDGIERQLTEAAELVLTGGVSEALHAGSAAWCSHAPAQAARTRAHPSASAAEALEGARAHPAHTPQFC